MDIPQTPRGTLSEHHTARLTIPLYPETLARCFPRRGQEATFSLAARVAHFLKPSPRYEVQWLGYVKSKGPSR
ncbi:hypothetical protein NLI96_g7876 [Meripilus lineatus]|uniref:Uncharacterized protein n=1 Tax=Meripilus lineatus TaxID=2056292 RepID=A0AAD5UYK2_9APHY|nr:hypothetical protein NLI96_g7876 [Physisporinus lineatus]